jgi:acyl dehydratase
MISPISILEIKVNDIIDLGNFSLSEEKIISYAKEFDPLPFHIDKKAGEDSMFRGIIASGPQIFHEVHKNEWLPRFGHSVICGMEVNNWKFKQPLYPNQVVFSRVTVKNIKKSKRKSLSRITWLYEFLDKNQSQIQTLEMVILHNLV